MLKSLRPQAEVKNIQVVDASGTVAMSDCVFADTFSFRPTQEEVNMSNSKVILYGYVFQTTNTNMPITI